MNFCKTVERLYGLSAVTCNKHLHCHLKDCLREKGPIPVFWCFSFEGYNGAFGKFQTNNKSVQIQFMKKIMTNKFCETLKESQKSSHLCDLLGEFFDIEENLTNASNGLFDIAKIFI